jgi:subtilase family serine protease
LANAKTVDTAPGTDRISFGLLLNMRDPSGAESTIQRISDPASADYGQWQSPDEFRSRFAPTASDVKAVEDWLKGQGFRLGKALPSGMLVEASGTASQVNKVFGTTVKDYSYRGQQVHANTGELSFPGDTPAAVVGAVGGVLGVDEGAQIHKPADLLPGPPPGFRSAEPCSDYYGQKTATDQPSFGGKKPPYSVCGYSPQQLQTAYGENSLLHNGTTGRGVTVAVVDAYASPFMPGDAQKYNRAHGQPAFTSGQYRQITPPADGYNSTEGCGAPNWYSEETLDVEAVHATAPGANIVYVGATDCNSGLDDAFAETVDNHTADIISNSWGAPTDDINVLGANEVKFYDQFTMEAALTGITVNVASGDAGDLTMGGANVGAKTVSFPADEPFVTGVGGTSLGIGNNGQHVFEYGWQSAFAKEVSAGWSSFNYSSGGGGGTSVIYQQPFYQKGKVRTADSEYFGGGPMRTIPDVAIDGDPSTGFLMGQTQVFPNGTKWDEFREGGTSLSTPLLAGMIAVADQAEHQKLGFVNPLFYAASGSSALNDISAPKSPVTAVRADFVNQVDSTGGIQYELENVDTQTTTLHSRAGYDTETGTGTPRGPQFFALLDALRG